MKSQKALYKQFLISAATTILLCFFIFFWSSQVSYFGLHNSSGKQFIDILLLEILRVDHFCMGLKYYNDEQLVFPSNKTTPDQITRVTVKYMFTWSAWISFFFKALQQCRFQQERLIVTLRPDSSFSILLISVDTKCQEMSDTKWCKIYPHLLKLLRFLSYKSNWIEYNQTI